MDTSGIVVTGEAMESFYLLNDPAAALWWSPKYSICLATWSADETPDIDPDSVYLTNWCSQQWWDQWGGDFVAAAGHMNALLHITDDDDLYG